jgi:hypothetical protein
MYTLASRVISRTPYRVGGRTIGIIIHTRDDRPPNPLQFLAGRDWYMGTDMSGAICGESNDRAHVQKRLRERAKQL